MKVFTGIGVVLFLLVGAIFVLGPAVARQIAFRHNPELVKQYERWRSDKITLPPEALEARTFSEATLAAAREFSKAWETNGKGAVSWMKTDHLSDFSRDPSVMADPARRAELWQFQPVMETFERLVRQPDYEISCLAEANPQSGAGVPVPDFLAVQTAAKLVGLKSAALREEGKLAEALASAQCIIQAAQGSPYDILISQLIGIAIEHIGTRAWSLAVERCADPALLHQTLKEQIQLAQRREFLSHDMNLSTMEHVAALREARRRGISVECQGRTGRELTALSYTALADLTEKQLAAEHDAEKRILIKQSLNGYRSVSATLGGDAHGVRDLFLNAVGPMASPMLFRIAVPNFVEAHTRAKVSYGKFDLLRLETARKLYALEHGGQAPASDGALVPAYLPALPHDRFSTVDQPYRFAGHYYSIGPDAKDDGQAFAYDPTNGSLSAGDMMLLASK